MANLGRLESVVLRDVWDTEAGHFTPWLAQDENIAVLAETIGMELEVEATEQNVGPFRADILCKDTATNDWVLIENQLEQTDHIHLGQLMTYAAGLNTVTIIWVAAKIREEHRAALDWLNKITNDDINFFGLEVELWKIGNSLAAPKFNVVCQPNDWTQSVSNATRRIDHEGLTASRQLGLEYWTAFRELLLAKGGPVSPRKAHAQSFYEMSIGKAGIWMSAVVTTQNPRVELSLVFGSDNAKAEYAVISNQREEIERVYGADSSKLDWQMKPDQKQSKICITKEIDDASDRSKWPEQQAWLYEQVQNMHRAFSGPVKALKGLDLDPDEEFGE